MADFDPSICFLFDNGSLRAASTLGLRQVALRLQERVAIAVKPVSLLHSSGVDADALNCRPAELLEPAVARFAEAGGREAMVLPLFFGPSAALVDYVPERLAALRERFPLLEVRQAGCLVQREDDSARLVAEALAAQVRAVESSAEPTARHVILVDHGSPRSAVTEVRNAIALELACALHGRVASVTAASMERRSGPAYAFNEPLLETALSELARNPAVSEIVIALQFLQPGRHAGPGGDIREICAEALQQAGRPDLRVKFTPLLGDSEAVLNLLERRWLQCLAAAD
ncbi:sirohydrochlorin chelatase [Actomonas aquatica]|uniref:CbiX/SirB N-terminal domain-containing protein n=1 Tax=Actomonas aquatica TaxID=2866162 RepID=A0ABZ1C936_9BACT|nr:CbiX/SirB N-terminal domain-containing protein [Opitutus sp. WL0086]WRQ88212.1 CbiX/SirB N-terminal domain-containing protein [Opitutus sp. WL0086]